MRRPFLHLNLFLLFIFTGVVAGAQIAPARMVRTPDIHGDRIVFSAEGDLWLGTLSGGVAWRLTTHEGTETNPRFSPDGKQIAFTGSYDGGQDVYVMPVEGGAPRRLTFDPTGAEVAGWTPDGAKILFRSRRFVPMVGPRLYLVAATGGVPEVLPMEKAAQGSFSSDGTKLAFCRLAMENHHWKRYRGGEANHIWIADLDKKTFRRTNDDTINEQYPVWLGSQIFYVSEKDGTANLWKYDTKTSKASRITSHETYDVKAPSSDGKKIIYQWGNGLWIYDPQTGKDQEVKLSLASDRIHARPHTVQGAVASLDLGPTGKRLVVEGRGQIFTLPAEKGDVRVIASAVGTRAKSPVWSPDGKSIAFISDRNGEENLWLAPASGTGEARQLTSESKLHLNGPEWSPDSKLIAFGDSSLALWLINAETKQKTLVARSEHGQIGGYSFSPDGKWMAYSRNEGIFVESLYLYNIANSKATRLTFPPTRDHHPVFDPSGKYLYFLSERSVTPQWDGFDFQMDFDKTTKVYLLSLAADTASPLPVESDEEPGADGKPADAAKPTDAKPADAVKPADAKPSDPAKPAAAPKLPDMKVDMEGISSRIMEIPIPAAKYRQLGAVTGKILYLVSGEAGPATLKAFDFTTKKEVDLAAGVMAYSLSNDRKKIVVQGVGGPQVADAGVPIPPTSPKVDLTAWRVEVKPELEWKQIFMEAWRNHRDSFYDPNLHGMDWNAVRAKYEALLPAVGARSELNEIIGDMQGEMNVSHEFNGGGYTRRQQLPSPGIGALGAELTYDSNSKAYKFARIFTGDGFDFTARSPLLAPGLKVKEGDYLLAINGQTLKADEEPSAELLEQSGKLVTLLVNDKPVTEGARTIRIKAMLSEARTRYYDWVSRCRDYVTKNGGSNIGYLHLPDMSMDGITEFTKQFYANLDKDGLVIDVRYNGGGIVSGQILERLRRVIFEYDQARYGAPEPYHRTAYIGRTVVLCNEHSGSDAEYFCTGYRYMKLGPTVGTRTWGGFMAVGGIGAIDGGFISTPVQGSFTPEGKWLPDGYGFNPDYVVDEDPNAFVAGKDPQLDKALELLKAEIKSNPPKWPKRLDPPSKEKAFGPNKK
jgi:tricorn protease